MYRNNGIGSDLLCKGEQEIKIKHDQINLFAPEFFCAGICLTQNQVIINGLKKEVSYMNGRHLT